MSDMMLDKSKKRPEPLPEKDSLADAIKTISVSMERLTRSGLNQKGVITLIVADTRLGVKTVKSVLDSLSSLAQKYTIKKKDNK